MENPYTVYKKSPQMIYKENLIDGGVYNKNTFTDINNLKIDCVGFKKGIVSCHMNLDITEKVMIRLWDSTASTVPIYTVTTSGLFSLQIPILVSNPPQSITAQIAVPRGLASVFASNLIALFIE